MTQSAEQKHPSPYSLRKPRRTPTENTEKSKTFDDRLISAINGHFGISKGKVDPRELWTHNKVTRYRLNWWDWDGNRIINTAFVRISVDEDGEIEIQEVT